MEKKVNITKKFSKHMWLHRDPEPSSHANQIFRSRSEPYLMKEKNTAVLSTEAHFDGDMIVHVPIICKQLLPKGLCDWIGPGEKVELEMTVVAHKKQLDTPITSMIHKAVEEERQEGDEFLKTHDRLLFVLIGEDVIRERQFVLYTPFADGSGRRNVEYIDTFGEIVHHSDDESPLQFYDVLGHVGDTVSPLHLGQIWGNLQKPSCCFKEFLVKAYQHGLRYEKPPKEDEIVFSIMNASDGIVKISCESDYFGFGENMLFNIQKDCRENARLGTRSLDKHLASVIVAYRWFYNRPNLHAVLKLASGQEMHPKRFSSLCNMVTKKVTEMYDKSQKSGKSNFFDPQKLRTKSLVIPYAEEICRT